MTSGLNIAFSLAGWLGQCGNVFLDLWPPKYKALVAALLGGVQFTVARIAQNYNPDGTPASVAYEKKKRRS